MPTRWVGIDEVGYGPNLGPLVMSAVVAEGPGDRPPDLWHDLEATVCRAGRDRDRLWVDDSKALYKPGLGRERLGAACLAVLSAADCGVPASVGGLLRAVGAGSLDDAELSPWLDAADPPFPDDLTRERWEASRALRPLEGAPWRVVAVR
ncbi:MAG: hypothetical protein LC745_13645, partial [Planctomycetia bacterium]|nr:hypothetical protein [Planctomycetia bacterium]